MTHTSHDHDPSHEHHTTSPHSSHSQHTHHASSLSSRPPSQKGIPTNVLIVLAVIAIALVAYQFFVLNPIQIKPSTKGDEFHAHADFVVFLEGEKMNFSQKRFMHQEACGKPGEEEHTVDLSNPADYGEAIHLHDLNGNVMHTHHENATLKMFFLGIGFGLQQRDKDVCITTADTKTYCETQTKKLKVFVSGVEEPFGLDYAPRDLDRILVSFGSETKPEITAQSESITKQSCIYSLKCPKPVGFIITPESCA